MVLHLLHAGLIEIRVAPHGGDAERARSLADALNNAPASVLSRSGDEVIDEVRRRCERAGEGDWFAEALQLAEVAAR